ncbi:hypothetical protein H634G_07267 [Metarhizium anisopliae BRIP 53293]|uniref:Uncharacterized protein n=1 Tax=Metarhizium anisopliae BRIP 53293 TaxID=1291518 RepID=A0A0D9NUS1_METAN|nr:hypothetical protein H634G_07267 [Metarhizium anisopliae BRIP 53293]KJK87458.1 hypothetical protein H633G_08681 [Metarhizium anisopliae BRIP 53284]
MDGGVFWAWAEETDRELIRVLADETENRDWDIAGTVTRLVSIQMAESETTPVENSFVVSFPVKKSDHAGQGFLTELKMEL